MGLIKAAADAVGGVIGDQWKDFYTVPDGLPATAALFAAAPRGVHAGRGANAWGSPGVISNGSRILVPEGYGLVLMEEGEITAFAAEAGAYEWDSDAPDSHSVFAGDGAASSLIKASWERFGFGGRPQTRQHAFFVSLKELPNNRFGTAREIYWDDAYLNAQVGALARGTYTLRIADPILFIRNWVPATYLDPRKVFDFTDTDNAPAQQLFHEVVGSLAQALSLYANDPGKANRMPRIQQDTVGVARSLSETVERAYGWRSERGLEIVHATIVGLEYDEASRELLNTVQRTDALLGARGNSLTAFKQLLAAGLISQADYDAAKAKVLGL